MRLMGEQCSTPTQQTKTKDTDTRYMQCQMRSLSKIKRLIRKHHLTSYVLSLISNLVNHSSEVSSEK